jgi:hypothetical protein
MNIDSPGVDALAAGFDREVFETTGFETDLGGRAAFGVGFAGDAGLSSNGSGLLSDLISDGDRGGVLAGGRFFFSGMPDGIIPSVGGYDQLASYTVPHCRIARADGKTRRIEDPKIRRVQARVRRHALSRV